MATEQTKSIVEFEAQYRDLDKRIKDALDRKDKEVICTDGLGAIGQAMDLVVTARELKTVERLLELAKLPMEAIPSALAEAIQQQLEAAEKELQSS
jgi:hypothetical protein